MKDDAQAAYDQFISNDWEQGGVDYSDTQPQGGSSWL